MLSIVFTLSESQNQIPKSSCGGLIFCNQHILSFVSSHAKTQSFFLLGSLAIISNS